MPNILMQTSTMPLCSSHAAAATLRKWLHRVTLTCTLMLLAPIAQADLNIDITGVGASQVSISVAPFKGNEGLPEDLKSVIQNDLERSGFFRHISTTSNIELDEESLIDPSAWQSVGVDALVAGSVSKLSDGRLDVRFNLHDTNQQRSLGRFSYIINQSALRLTAHKIADYVYAQFLGEPGVFATRLAYVEKHNGNNRLIISDSDGANAQTALASNEPIISPAWSPDGTQIAYVSFETRKPVVFIHTLATGRRRAIANFKGSNSAPTWAPDGQKLALVLTKDGGSQIYTMDQDGRNLTRLTSTGGINTEPVYSQDGQSIYFTSDRGGGPQIYRMNPDGSNVTRVTFSGNYNISPRISPDGTLLTYVTRREGLFKIATLDLQSGAEALLTSTTRDESPSFAPNGRFILYATKRGGRGILALVSKSGNVKQQITSSQGDISEPTWGPMMFD